MLGTNCDMMCDVIDGLIRKTIVGLDGISGVENFFCRRLCVCGVRDEWKNFFIFLITHRRR